MERPCKSIQDLVGELESRNIRLSHQRLMVLEYMANHTNHPTVDQIYVDIQKEIPTLSKATVYNSLKALVSAGLVSIIPMENNENRFDIITTAHGHFCCEVCGNIEDFPVNIDTCLAGLHEGYQVHSWNVLLNGICKTCKKAEKERKFS